MPSEPHVRQQDVWSLSGPALAGLLREVLAGGRSCRFQARGASMHPFIRNRDVLTVSRIPPGGPSVGDVVVSLPPSGRPVAHRVVRTGPGGVVTKGDALPHPEPPVTQDAVLGAVTAVERGGRTITLGLGFDQRLLALLSRTGLLDRGLRVAGTARSAMSRRRATGRPEA